MTDSSQPVRPLELVPESWVMSTMITGAGGLLVQHEFDEPIEIAIPALTHHSMSISLCN